MILELDNVELSFKNKQVLNGIYLKAETGKITSILGSNGSGKSCLLHILFGSLKAKYSSIRLDKKTILKPLYLKHKIAFLPQHYLTPNQIKVFSAFKLFQVDWDEFILNFPRNKIDKSKKIQTLSGGERRLLEIYLVLKKEAHIVLLDEPFNGIEPFYIEKIKTIINEEKHKKIILLTDHRYMEVIDVSDTIYLIKNGCSKLINNLKELEDYSYLNSGNFVK
ncbi:ATP-binding cassette domain-containing protein [Xanthomarina gelatinilytica]|uniref:ATP-binding cassette domain-containing protein n=1 Tax=Xanthomarina gelatinilytica TaxID=1137281 RepID=UPI00351347B3